MGSKKKFVNRGFGFDLFLSFCFFAFGHIIFELTLLHVWDTLLRDG